MRTLPLRNKRHAIIGDVQQTPRPKMTAVRFKTLSVILYRQNNPARLN